MYDEIIVYEYFNKYGKRFIFRIVSDYGSMWKIRYICFLSNGHITKDWGMISKLKKFRPYLQAVE